MPSWSLDSTAAKVAVLGTALCATVLLAWPLLLHRTRLTFDAHLEAAASSTCLVQVSNYALGADALADASMHAWALYALRHGYRYLRVMEQVAANGSAQWQTAKCNISWRKGAAALRHLKECELLVLLDVDVNMVDWGTPLEELLQIWGFSNDSLLLQPEDPDLPFNWIEANGSHWLSGNTGFMVFRNRAETHSIIERWLGCPEKVARCDEYLHVWPCDQGAWNRYLRPTLTPGQLVLVPCTDANSFPDAPQSHSGGTCTAGRYLNHYWVMKDRLLALLTEQFADNARQAMLAHLARSEGLELPP